jgi:hypothetical protein
MDELLKRLAAVEEIVNINSEVDWTENDPVLEFENIGFLLKNIREDLEKLK